MKNHQTNRKVDVLFIGAHQDDVEATVGGIMLSLVDRGYEVEILDLTRRRGMYYSEEEERDKEAECAAKVLGVRRTVVDMGMLKVSNTHGNRLRIAEIIRTKKPDVIVTHPDDPSHPDHKAAHQLVRDAIHYGFATAIKTKHPPWRIKKVYYFPLFHTRGIPPNGFLVDVSKYFETKMEALKCYASQMLFHAHNQKYELEYLTAMNRYWGLMIKKDYAEVILADMPQLEPFPELEKK
ncbi:PIG-L family deacetylase [Patescibacteria group bacterium]|nr:PIG-L family deacetylase [Patescibacteria group bacterium]